MPKLKDLEQRIQRTEQQLRLFQKVSRFMVREMSLQEVLQGVVSLVAEFMECDSCLVYLCDVDDLRGALKVVPGEAGRAQSDGVEPEYFRLRKNAFEQMLATGRMTAPIIRKYHKNVAGKPAVGIDGTGSVWRHHVFSSQEERLLVNLRQQLRMARKAWLRADMPGKNLSKVHRGIQPQ